MRHLALILGSISFIATAQQAVTGPWATKRPAEWTDKEAQLVLQNSPWGKRTVPSLLPGLSAFERRDGGNMAAQGGGRGMELDKLKDFSLVGSNGLDNHPGKQAKTLPDRMIVRWESALPIRAAEFKTPESSAPDINGEDYAIAIYDVNLKLASIDPKDWKGLPGELKKISALKVEGRKDVRPSEVIVIGMGDGMATVVYLFPRSIHITVDDARIEFDAQIGRLGISQYFYPPEMLFQGKLEL